jgi:hypothetical protein
MKFPRWDRIYFFAFSASAFAVASFLGLFVIPLVEITNTETGDVSSRTLLEDGQGSLLWLSLLPVVLSGSTLLVLPRYGRPDRAAKINLWISTFLIYVFVILFILVNGILFLPTAILITAAAVGAMVRRRERTVFAKSAEESKSGRGGGKRRRNKG